ncbi:MAG: fibronectin type III domain-containing protein [Thermoanaerobaculia bacterium]
MTGVGTAFNSAASILALDGDAGSAALVWSHTGPLDEVGKAQVGFGGTPWLATRRGSSPRATAAAVAPSGQTLLGTLAPEFRGGPTRASAFFLDPSKPLPFPPPSPAGVRAVRNGSSIDVTWNPVEGATAYRIETTTYGTFYDRGTSITNRARIPDQSATQVRVIALNSGGESPPSVPAEVEEPQRKRLLGR